jgi:DNA replication protein DnaC
MLTRQTQEKLKKQRLMGMLEELERQESLPNIMQLPFDERLAMLVDAQEHFDEQRKYLRMLKSAKLKDKGACIEDIDYRVSRGLDKAYFQSLSLGKWLENHQHIAITGSAGTGKSYIACALSHQAIRLGFSVLFYRFPRLLEDLEVSRLDGSLPKFRMRLAKVSNLVIDDFALSPLSDNAKQDLLEIIDDRVGCGSLIFTSQLPMNKWHEYINEPTYADAIMDRVVHRTHKLELHGGSMRKVYGGIEEASS